MKLHFPSPDIKLEIIKLWNKGQNTLQISEALHEHKLTEALVYEIITDYVEMRHRR